MFRKELKVLDCTIRDGGLINNYQFSYDFVKAIYAATAAAGVDYMEIGKKLCESDEYTREKYGKWNFCDEDDIKQVVESYEGDYHPVLAVMYDVGRVDTNSMLPVDQSVIGMIRTACYVADIDKGLDLVKRCKDQGYETTLNIMAPSAAIEKDLIEGLQEINNVAEVDYLYLVDSYGAFYSEQISAYIKLKFL